MEHSFSNIKDYKIMYLMNSIGSTTTIDAHNFENNKNNIYFANMYLYNYLLSNNNGIAHFKNNLNMHLFLKLNEILYDNFDNKNMIIKKFKELIDNYKKSEYGIDIYNLNTIYILGDHKEKDKNKYYSLIFLAVPFALKIKNKQTMIKEIDEFIKNFTNDENQILSTIVTGLFINYALNNINIEKWIENINHDIKSLKTTEKYLDYINNYSEINFRNGTFITKKIENLVVERNISFYNNFCNKNDEIFGQKPEQQVLIILDSLLRSKDNWEKLILYGICNYGDNINTSIVIGILFEIIFSSNKINKNLLKRFRFN
jgi:hypothetical protein